MVYLHALLYALMLFPEDETPALNRKIVEYVQEVIGHQVGTGECWDLAAAAIDYSGAYLDRSSQISIYIFGRKFDPKQESVYPGDIIQLENVRLEYEKDNMIVTETMPHHTAIIYEILGQSRYIIAHQNTRFSGRKVGLSELDLLHVQSGDLLFYRPVAGPQ